MNKELTIVFSSYQSQHLLKKILYQFNKKYKIIIIENSLDIKIKKLFEKKYKNVEVIIPKENLGLAKSYNLGIKKAKTRFVFLNNPDIEIDDQTIKKLILCAKKIKNCGVISPTYKKEKIYKNYEIIHSRKKQSLEIFKKFEITEVDSIDNNFLINKNKINKIFFDENFFLYFETIDFVSRVKKSGKKLFVAKKIKFHHFGSSSLPSKYTALVKKTRSFHYNWSKFYFYRKNFNYFYAIKKIYPNFIKAIKKVFVGLVKFEFKIVKLSFLELLGIFSALLFLNSFYRPKN